MPSRPPKPRPRTPKRRRSHKRSDSDEADLESDPPTPPKRAAARATAMPSSLAKGPSPPVRTEVRAGAPRFARHASSPSKLFGGVVVHEGHGLRAEPGEGGLGFFGGREWPARGQTTQASAVAGDVSHSGEHLLTSDTWRLEQLSGLALGLTGFGAGPSAGDDYFPQRPASQAGSSDAQVGDVQSLSTALIPTPTPPPVSYTSRPPTSPAMERSSFSPYSNYTRSLWGSTSPRPSPCPSPPIASPFPPLRPALTADSRRHSSALTFASSFAGLTVSSAISPPLGGVRAGFTFPAAQATVSTSAETPATRGLAASLSAHESCLQGGRRSSLPSSPVHSKASSVSSTLSETLSAFGSTFGLHHQRASPERKGGSGGAGAESSVGRRRRSGSVFAAVTQATKSTLDYAVAAMNSSPPRPQLLDQVLGMSELPKYHQLSGLPGWIELNKITVQLRAVDPSPDNVSASAFLDWLMNGKDQHWGADRSAAKAGKAMLDEASSTSAAVVAGPARQPLTPRQSMQDMTSPAESPLRSKPVGGISSNSSGSGPKIEFAAGPPLVVVESARWCFRFAPEGRNALDILKHVLAGPV